jgi:tetratricopeptide (TPR) repeat protein
MTTITLQEYHQRIAQLIEDNRLSDAISHCRHILESHPRQIDTYRLMGRAMLEQHDYDGASDLFQRVLSADPNDMVSHIGLAEIRREDSYEDALWHLERAFEIEPYNPAIQEELRQQYVQMSDMAVDRIPLTSGALARLHIKGELYQQAVQELRQTLRETQDRVDLEVLLAEALWRNDQRIDAEEVCLNVLQKLPNCIVVNAILSEIWLQTGRIGESQKYLRRLQDLTSLDKSRLDMDTAVGRAFRTDGAPPLPDQIELELKGDLDGAAVPATAVKGPSADWMSEVTFDGDMSEKFEYGREPAVVDEAPSSMHSYDWMADVNDDLTVAEEVPLESEWFMDDTLAADAAIADDADDDWLARLGDVVGGDTAAPDDFALLFADDDTAAPEPAIVESSLDWFSDQADQELPSEGAFASEEGVPDWLSGMVDVPDVEDVAAITSATDSDWFGNEGADEEVAIASEGIPDWLSGLVDEDDAPEAAASDAAVAEVPAAAATDDTGWFIDPKAEDAWDEGAYAAEEVPDWLFDQMGTAETAASEPITAETAAADITPVWLRNQTGELEDSLQMPPAEADLDDWFSGSEPAEKPAEPAPAAASTSFTDWLFSVSEEEPETAEELPALGLAGAVVAAIAANKGDEAEADLDDLDALWADISEDSEPDTAVPTPTEAEEDDWLGDSGADDWAGSDWLEDFAEKEPETSAMAQFPPDSLADLADSDEEEIPDWLLGNEQVELGKAEAVVMGDKDKNGQPPPEMPEPEMADDADWSMGDDWLADFNEEAGELEEADEADELMAASEGLPDWLGGFTDSADADDDDFLPEDILPQAEGLPDWLSGFAEETAVSKAEPVADDYLEDALDFEDEFSLTADADDDLSDILAGSGAMEDWLTAEPLDTADAEAGWLSEEEPATFDWEAPASKGLTAWLAELPDAPEDTPVAAPTPEPAEQITSGVPDIPSEELFATDADNLPDWLSAQPDDFADDLEDSNLPDWLAGATASTDTPAMLESEDLLDLEEDEVGRDLLDSLEMDDELAGWEAEADAGLTAVGLTALFSSLDDQPSTIGDLDTDIAWLGEMNTADDLDETLPAEVAEEVGLDWLGEETAVPELELAAVDMDADAAVGDMDDTISWLEDLAAQQETPVEELPTVAKDLLEDDLAYLDMAEPADVMDEVVDDFMVTAAGKMAEPDLALVEESDSWLDVLMAEETELPPEDDPEAAMAWLEGLAARQGAPLDELPSQQKQAGGELDELVSEAEADLEEAIAWMDDLSATPAEEWPEIDEGYLKAALAGAVVAQTKTAEPSPDDELEDALDFLADQLKAEGITPVVADGTARLSDAELAATLDWLEATEQEETTAVPHTADLIEESWHEPLAEEFPDVEEMALVEAEEFDFDLSDMPDDPDAAMAWLQAITGDEGDIKSAMQMPISPAVTVDAPEIADEELLDEEEEVFIPRSDFLVKELETAVPAEEELLTAVPDMNLDEIPDDPDAAMAWLLTMSEIDVEMEPPPITPSADAAFTVEYGKPVLDILPEPELVVEDEMETAVDSFDLLSDELADDESWLEDMLGGDLAIDVDMEPPPITPSADAAFAVEYGEPVLDILPEPELVVEEEVETAVDSFDLLSDELADDESWLEDMLGGDLAIDVDMEPPPITPSADAAFAVDYGDAPAAVEPVEEVVEAAPVSIAAEDLFTAVPEDPDEAMAWLEEIAKEQGEYLQDEDVAEPDESSLPAWMQMEVTDTAAETDDFALPDLPATETDLDIIEDLGVGIDDDLSDSLPDWFSMDTRESTGTGQTGWLRSFEDIDVGSWLTAEAEATTTDFDDEMVLPETGELRLPKPPASDRLPLLPTAESDMPAESYEVEPVAATPAERDTAELTDARTALAQKKYGEAVTHYQQLIASGTATLGLIAELETLTDDYPTQPAFQRLLGDAYMRNGQLQKALNAYRTALDQL